MTIMGRWVKGRAFSEGEILVAVVVVGFGEGSTEMFAAAFWDRLCDGFRRRDFAFKFVGWIKGRLSG